MDRSSSRNPNDLDGGSRPRVGWGLGEYGVKEARDGEGRLREARRELREGGLLGSEEREEAEGEVEGEEGWVDEEVVRTGGGRAVQPVVEGTGRRKSVDGGRKRTSGKSRGRRGSRDEPSPESSNNDPIVGGWSWWGPLSESRFQSRSLVHSLSTRRFGLETDLSSFPFASFFRRTMAPAGSHNLLAYLPYLSSSLALALLPHLYLSRFPSHLCSRSLFVVPCCVFAATPRHVLFPSRIEYVLLLSILE